jgi:hypothetical protein
LFIFRLNASLLEEKSVVPHTWGPHKTPTGESCLVAFFSDGQQVQRAKDFINSLKVENVRIIYFYFQLYYVVHIIADLTDLCLWNFSLVVIPTLRLDRQNSVVVETW